MTTAGKRRGRARADQHQQLEHVLGFRLPTRRPPTHPGEMLLEEFLEPLGLSQSQAQRELGISWPRLNEIVRGKRPVTLDSALRFAAAFGTSVEFWMTLQNRWDAYWALQDPELRRELARIRSLGRGSGREGPGNGRASTKAQRTFHGARRAPSER